MSKILSDFFLIHNDNRVFKIDSDRNHNEDNYIEDEDHDRSG